MNTDPPFNSLDLRRYLAVRGALDAALNTFTAASIDGVLPVDLIPAFEHLQDAIESVVLIPRERWRPDA